MADSNILIGRSVDSGTEASPALRVVDNGDGTFDLEVKLKDLDQITTNQTTIIGLLTDIKTLLEAPLDVNVLSGGL